MSSSDSPLSQSSTERSPQIRKEILRDGLTRAQILKENINNSTVHALEEVMEESDKINLETSLNEKISNQEEVVLDSEVMSVSSTILKEHTESITKSIRHYKPMEFAQKLVQHVLNILNTNLDVPDWSVLEGHVSKCFKRTPNYMTILGTLKPLERKEIVRKEPAKRDARTATRRPENVVTADKEEESVEIVAKIKKIITQHFKTHSTPIEFFHLILHPEDFGKSVENMLHVAFLVRDGFLKLKKNESGMLMIHPCSKEMIAQAKQADKIVNIQNVMTLTIEQWKILKDLFRLKEPMIK